MTDVPASPPEGAANARAALPGTAPGWFADPDGLPRRRYWSGEAWTTRVAPQARGVERLIAHPSGRWKDPDVDAASGRNTYASIAVRAAVLALGLLPTCARLLLAGDGRGTPDRLVVPYLLVTVAATAASLGYAGRGLERAGASGIGRRAAWVGLALGVATAVVLAALVTAVVRS